MTRPGSWPRSPPVGTFRKPSAGPDPELRRKGARPARASSCGDSVKGFEAGAINPVAEAFLGPAIGAEPLEKRLEQSGDLGDRNVGSEHAVESGAVEVAAEHDVVLAEGGADEADVAQVWTRAPVRTATHAEADALIGETNLVEDCCELPDQSGQRALRFGDCKPAGGDRGAGHGVTDRLRDGFHRRDAVLGHQLLDARTVGGIDAGEDHVLLRGEADLRAQLVDDLAQPGAGTDAVDVGDATVLDVDADVEPAVTLLVPAEVVVDGLPGQRLGLLELERHATLDLVTEPLEPAVGVRGCRGRAAASAAPVCPFACFWAAGLGGWAACASSSLALISPPKIW